MPTLLLCTDGSTYASSIYDHASWAATRLSAGVEVLHVIDHHREFSPAVDLSGSIGIDASAQLTEELTKLEETQGRVALLKGNAILEHARQQLQASGIAEVITTQRHGNLVETLEEMEARFDLVVIGKRGGHADFAAAHLGSNLQRVIRTIKSPVLIATLAFKPIKRFMVAFDGSATATKAIEFVCSSPLLKGATCHLLRAERIDDKTKNYLEDIGGRLRAVGYDVTTELNPGSVESVIEERVKSENIDLLVMGAYGQSPIRHLVLGSTTTTIVRTVQVPVLLIR